MISVYRVMPDVDKYQYLLSEDFDRDYLLDGMPKGKSWKSFKMYSLKPLRPAPYFWDCFLYGNMIAVEGRELEPIRGFVDQSCELLPLSFGRKKMSLLNVVEVVDVLDKKRSKFVDEDRDSLDKYAFLSKRFTHSLFKIPETRRSEVLCVEGLCDPQDEFKGSVEALGLTGLRFHKLWSGRSTA
jgi:hypothetical protein